MLEKLIALKLWLHLEWIRFSGNGREMYCTSVVNCNVNKMNYERRNCWLPPVFSVFGEGGFPWSGQSGSPRFWRRFRNKLQQYMKVDQTVKSSVVKLFLISPLRWVHARMGTAMPWISLSDSEFWELLASCDCEVIAWVLEPAQWFVLSLCPSVENSSNFPSCRTNWLGIATYLVDSWLPTTYSGLSPI